MTFPTDEVEFRINWSVVAGTLEGVKAAQAEAERRSGEAFIRGRDEVANALRDLATALAYRVKELTKTVDEYKAESADRKRRIARLQH